jgi:hypothetical protein
MYLKKLICKKTFFCTLKVTDEKEQDPEPDPNPLVRGTDPRIRIRTKMSRIRYPGENNSFTTAHVQTLLYVVIFLLYSRVHKPLFDSAKQTIRLSKTNDSTQQNKRQFLTTTICANCLTRDNLHARASPEQGLPC